MKTPTTSSAALSSPTKRLAVVTMGVKLGDETRGYTRFRFLSELLAQSGFEVDLITSSFQHWEKAARDTDKKCYRDLPYNVVFIDEPGYKKNLDLERIHSHHIAAKNMRAYFAQHSTTYDLIYAEIPPNDVARVCAEAAAAAHIPFVADINDLWPEAMRMVVDIPLISDLLFYPFARDAEKVYSLLSAAVGTSDEYAARPAERRSAPYLRTTVYVGNDLAAFDAGAACYARTITKPADELWVTYAGTLGASYDLCTLIAAAAQLHASTPELRIKILGDGPDKENLVEQAAALGAPVDFLGYLDYEHMAAYLVKSDITINSLVKSAPQSIVTKIGDYLASGHPMINTGSSPEFRCKVTADGFGINVEAEDVPALTEAIGHLVKNPSTRKIMGAHGRHIAETEFDQPTAYQKIVDLIQTLV
ncbi:MAG: glycosyltransferase family 4 protein [Raoultibacter sp.]